MSVLGDETLASLEEKLTIDRVGFLSGLKERGVDKLADRQKLANSVATAKRLDRF